MINQSLNNVVEQLRRKPVVFIYFLDSRVDILIFFIFLFKLFISIFYFLYALLWVLLFFIFFFVLFLVLLLVLDGLYLYLEQRVSRSSGQVI